MAFGSSEVLVAVCSIPKMIFEKSLLIFILQAHHVL